ncbi:hypothetical protein OG225_06675 [Nocardia sp. NBC_01377]|uniref:hypothetical protein n=1 Tax=Nocardia sp. NBC_01377 TaxID=2903595 RepID=UPI0032509F80
MADSYTIAISHSRTGIVVASATVEIDTAGARLTEVRAEPSGQGSVPEALASINFPLLVRTARMLSSVSAPADPSSAPAPVSADDSEPPTSPPIPGGDSEPNLADPTSPSPLVGTGEPNQAKTNHDVVTSTVVAGRREAANSDPRKTIASTAVRAKPSPEEKAGAPADFGVTYWRLGSIAKVAKHYDIPHHIAQDWIKSLQQQGKLASPWPSKSARPLRPR